MNPIGWILTKIYNLYRFLKIEMLTIFFSLVFRKFGRGTKVNGGITFYCPENIEIGKECTINIGVMLNASKAKIVIGDYVRISPYVMINTAGLDRTDKSATKRHFGKKVIIEEDVWIQTNAIISPGVTLGKGSEIGAGAVVTKDVAPYTFVGGIPAVKIKDLPKTSPSRN